MFDNTISMGLLHCHTEHSLLDSTMSPERLCERAAELGCKAIALTDHGTMTGIPKFKKAAQNQGILPIVGVEAYIADRQEDRRLHLILMAMDRQGEVAIGKFVTETNTNIAKVGKLVFPTGTKEMLKKYFGTGSMGHGHVLATSACINGVVLGLHFQNEANKQAIAVLKDRTKQYADALGLISYCKRAIEEGKQRIAELSPLVKKSFKARENFLLKIKEEEAYAAEEEKLNAEKLESKQAEAEIKKIKTQNIAIQKKMTQYKKQLPKESGMLEEQERQLQEAEEKLMSAEQLIEAMKEEARFYNTLFGTGNFYLEIQNHGMPEEIMFMPAAVRIGEELDIPYVAANDVHMASKQDAAARETIRSLRFNKWAERQQWDEELYIKTDAELFRSIAHVIGKGKAKIAMENIKVLVSRCTFKEVNEKHYPIFSEEDADALLRKMAYDGISKRFSEEAWTSVYVKRLEYELQIIAQMGVANYHLIDQDFINFTKKLGNMPEDRLHYLETHIDLMSYEELVEYVEADQSNIGYVIGPGRGSAAGSLVCYLIGITNIDPIRYNLLFERYLNPERVTMPDIDTDFANGYRDLAVKYVAKKYGEDKVCRIMTQGTAAARGAIRNAARVLSTVKEADEGTYSMLADLLAKKIPLAPQESIGSHISEMETVFEEYKEARPIIDRALGIEGVAVQYGMHAGGVIISDHNAVSDYVPLMYDERTQNWKCQCDMNEAEELGLLKMDFLGLINLNIITDTIRLIWKNRGIRINPDKDIREEKKVIKAICAAGKTNSIFQLESGGMKSMLQQFGPDSFEDLILLLAAYRPGPMEYIPQMIAVKHGLKPLTYATPELESILSVTYGCIIYQEQVQLIFQRLAGYSLGQADIVRRAMSKKKDKALLAERDSFIHGDPERGIKGCVANHIDEVVASQLFDSMVDFAKYAFNKSHAAAYARITYITAWLKFYYPTEYLCIAMEYAAPKKMQGLIAECKANQIKVHPIDINASKAKFYAEGRDIYFGMTSIKGIGSLEYTLKAREAKPFISFTDYMLRGHFDKKITENLIMTGAFDKFCNNRKALLSAASVMMDYVKDMKDTQAKINEMERKLEVISMEASEDVKRSILESEKIKVGKKLPALEKVQSSLEGYRRKKKELHEGIQSVVIPVEIPENLEEKLNVERELLGVYITGHPLDAYTIPPKSLFLANLTPKKKSTVTGIIRDLRVIPRKSDGAEMAFFNLEDKTATVECICFAAKYELCKEYLREGLTVTLNGNVVETEKEVFSKNEETDGPAGEMETEMVLQIFCETCMKAEKKRTDIIMEVPSIMEWADHLQHQAKEYVMPDAPFRLVLYDKLFRETRPTNMFVSATIRNAFHCL